MTRGSLQHDKKDDGRVDVYLDVGDRRRVDDGQDAGVDSNSNALISQLRDEVAYLRDENRRKDEIIMQQSPGPLRTRLRKPESAAGGSSGDKGRNAGRKESKRRR